MEKLFQLASDIAKLWSNYGVSHYLPGIRNTLILALVATLIGCVIGFVCGVLNTIPHSKNDPPVKRFFLALVRAVVRIYVEVFRGTPMVLQAVFIFYGLPYFTDGAVAFRGMSGIWVAAIIVVSINTGAYMAEIVRGGIISVNKGQKEAACAIGMTHWQSMVHVVLPQAVRNIMPSIGNEFVVNIKDSSVLNVISVNELFFMSKSAAGTYLRYFEVFFITACIYLVLTFTVTRLLRLLERRMDGKTNYIIYGSQSDSKASIVVPKEGGVPND